MTATDHQPTVFVVDDDLAVRDSVRYLLESIGLTVETFESAESFLEAQADERAGCLVLDVRMHGMSGLELQARLQQSGCCLPIIMLTAYADVPTTVRAFSNGVMHFLEKPFSDQELIDYVQRAIVRNGALREKHAQHQDVLNRLARLTPRERSVLEHVVEGKQNKETARVLGLSEKTVEVHRAHLMDKMGASGVAELVRMTHAILAEQARQRGQRPPEAR